MGASPYIPCMYHVMWGRGRDKSRLQFGAVQEMVPGRPFNRALGELCPPPTYGAFLKRVAPFMLS